MDFTRCMRGNGVDMADPTVDVDGNVIPGRPTNLGDTGSGEGPDASLCQELRDAFQACGDLLQGSFFGFTQQDQTQLQDQLLQLAQCLRDQSSRFSNREPR